MKTGLFLRYFVLGMGATGAALAADPEPAPAAATDPKPAEPAAAPSASDKPAAVPIVDIDPKQEPEKKKTASELEAATQDEYSSKQDKGGSEVSDEDFGHGMQFGLRAGLSGGYRMVFRYDKSPFCRTPDRTSIPPKADKDQQKFCGHGAPLAVDLALSFAPLDFAEPYVWARFGLAGEPQTNTESVMAFGAGARIYTMSDSKFKIYVEPAVGVEVESGAGNDEWKFEDGSVPDYKKDFLFHLAVGGQYDFARAFGIYVNAGITTGVLRYIHTGLEIGGGAQVRVP